MSESTPPAQTSDELWVKARAAGLFRAAQGTNAFDLAIDRFAAAIHAAAIAATSAEPVYQRRPIGLCGVPWHDVTHQGYEGSSESVWEKRIVYAAPLTHESATTVYDPVYVRTKFADYQSQIDGLKEELLTREAATVPEGFKLVPAKPTPEMEKAALDFKPIGGPASPREIYYAMLAAAPASIPIVEAATVSLNDEQSSAIEYTLASLRAIADRKEQVVDVIEPLNDIRAASTRAKAALRRFEPVAEVILAAAPASRTDESRPTLYPACAGMNCGVTDGKNHSLDCQAEHAVAIAGGQFMKPQVHDDSWMARNDERCSDCKLNRSARCPHKDAASSNTLPRASDAALAEEAHVAKRMSETLAEVYLTILGDDTPDSEGNAFDKVLKAAQVLRMEVDLYRAQAAQPGADDTGAIAQRDAAYATFDKLIGLVKRAPSEPISPTRLLDFLTSQGIHDRADAQPVATDTGATLRADEVDAFEQMIDEFGDTGETMTDDATLLDWVRRGLLICDHFTVTTAGGNALAAAIAAAAVKTGEPTP